MVGGEIDQKGEQMFALRRNAPGCVKKGAGAGNSAGRIKKKKKKKKILPLLLYHRSVALVNRFLKTFFIKFCDFCFVKY